MKMEKLYFSLFNLSSLKIVLEFLEKEKPKLPFEK
jgi:hypothetical protein